MIRFSTMVVAGVAILASAGSAHAQNWSGFYVAGSVGAGFQKQKAGETVRFDTDLNGTFADAVRTAAGVDAFSPGFCGGLAVNSTAAAGCSSDEGGFDFGGRLGYDRQVGSFVLGGLFEMSRPDITDSATAFSTTPAFYSFTREVEYLGGVPRPRRLRQQPRAGLWHRRGRMGKRRSASSRPATPSTRSCVHPRSSDDDDVSWYEPGRLGLSGRRRGGVSNRGTPGASPASTCSPASMTASPRRFARRDPRLRPIPSFA